MDRTAQLPKMPVVIGGKTYDLTGNVAALAEAEWWFNSLGQRLDLFTVFLGEHTEQSALAATRELLPCMLHAAHPEIDFLTSQGMIDRAIASDDPTIFDAVRKLCRAANADQSLVNRSLIFDLDGLADANDHFEGKSGISWICFVEGLTPLDRAYRVFPCALHRSRPELTLSEARALITWDSVAFTAACMQELERVTSWESKQKFAARLLATASEEEKEQFTLLVIAKDLAPGAAQA